MRCLQSPVAILTAFFFRQNPILSLISCVSRRPGLDGKQITQSLFWIVRADGWFVLWKNIVNGMTADMKFTRDTPFAITAYSIHVYYWLSFYHSLHFTFAFGLYKGHYTYPMVAQFSTGILAHFSISIYSPYSSGSNSSTHEWLFPVPPRWAAQIPSPAFL